jgi:hypothetical protein
VQWGLDPRDICRVLYRQRIEAAGIFEPLLRIEVPVVTILEVPCQGIQRDGILTVRTGQNAVFGVEVHEIHGS